MNEQHTIIFVYHAQSDLFSMATDYVHKLFSPSTYQCQLCKLTYGNAGIKKQWKNFLQQLPFQKVFLYQKEFAQQYPSFKSMMLPAVFISKGADISPLLSAEEINSMNSLDALQSKLEQKLQLL